VTIYDIAQEAGVSASTVSRVLNQKPGVKPETRKKIEKLLEKHHFEPNASAQGLVSQSSRLIGIMVSDIRTQHHAEGAYFIEQQLQEQGYSCLIVNSGFSEQGRENGLRLLASRRVEAIVLIGSTFQTEGVRRNIERYLGDLPIVMENGCIDLPNVYSVLADERNGVAACVQLLLKRGKRKLAYLSLENTPSNALKLEGYRTAAGDANAAEVEIARQDEEEAWDAGYRATQALMRRQPELDGLIFATDQLANAGVRCLQDLGYAIPQQVAVIGVDNSVYATLSRPQLTCVDNKMRELSLTCADHLIRILQGKKVAHRMMILSDIVERDTT
jgi:LacI family transcriptional regulator